MQTLTNNSKLEEGPKDVMEKAEMKIDQKEESLNENAEKSRDAEKSEVEGQTHQNDKSELQNEMRDDGKIRQMMKTGGRDQHNRKQPGNISHQRFMRSTALAQMPGSQALMHEVRLRNGMALTDNSEILKVINMNKMQHQYIQNLQKANMTLKCKIKEVSELKTEQDLARYKNENLKNYEEMSEDEDEDADLVDDDEFTLEEVGYIEDVSYKQAQAEKKAKERKRQFYDRNSISRTRPKSTKQEKEFYDKRPQKPRNSEYYQKEDSNVEIFNSGGKRQGYQNQRRNSVKGRGYNQNSYYQGYDYRYSQGYYAHPNSGSYMHRYQRMQYGAGYGHGYYETEAGGYPYHYNDQGYRRRNNYLEYLEDDDQGYPSDNRQRRQERVQYQPKSGRDERAHQDDKKRSSENSAPSGQAQKRQGEKQEYHYVKKYADKPQREIIDLNKDDQPLQKPAVLQVRRENEQKQRDLRPAVFIKDLKKRSEALEEEKEQHFLRIKQKGVKNQEEQNPVQEKTTDTLVHTHIQSLETAIAQKDSEMLSERILKAKLIQLEVKQDKMSTRLQELIDRAEQHMLEITAKIE